MIIIRQLLTKEVKEISACEELCTPVRSQKESSEKTEKQEFVVLSTFGFLKQIFDFRAWEGRWEIREVVVVIQGNENTHTLSLFLFTPTPQAFLVGLEIWILGGYVCAAKSLVLVHLPKSVGLGIRIRTSECSQKRRLLQNLWKDRRFVSTLKRIGHEGTCQFCLHHQLSMDVWMIIISTSCKPRYCSILLKSTHAILTQWSHQVGTVTISIVLEQKQAQSSGPRSFSGSLEPDLNHCIMELNINAS